MFAKVCNLTMPAHRSDRVQLLKQVQTFTLELLHCFTSVILAITLPQEPVSKKTNKQHILYIYITRELLAAPLSLSLSFSLTFVSLPLPLSHASALLELLFLTIRTMVPHPGPRPAVVSGIHPAS